MKGPVPVSELLPAPARAQLVQAARFPIDVRLPQLDGGEAWARTTAVDRAIALVRREYPQFFK